MSVSATLDKQQSRLNKLQKIGKRLEKEKDFIITNLVLGKGGYGSVMSIYDKVRKMDCAIKIINVYDDDGGIDDIELQKAQKEADILKSCKHNNIVEYIDSFLIGTNFFIQMELCKTSLQNWVDIIILGSSMQRNIFLSLAVQIIQAISFLHKKDYVLRDLSLNNILFDYQQLQIKLCDFGAMKKINIQKATETFTNNNTGIIGVQAYYPPELFESKNEGKYYQQDFRGDVWAYGVCLYLMTGVSSQHVKQYTERKESFQYSQNIDKDILIFIEGILIHDPINRPTVQEVIKRLIALIKDKPSSLQQVISYEEKKEEKDIKNEGDYYNKGMCLLQEKKYDETITMFQKCLEINPRHQEAIYGISHTYYEQKNYETAIDWAQKCLSLNPFHKLSLVQLGHIYFQKGMYDLAIDYYTCTLNHMNHKNQNNINCNNNNQDQDKQEGKSKIMNATEEYGINNNIILKNEQLEELYLNLGIAYYQKKQFKKAIDILNKCLDINPNNIDAKYKQDECYQIQNNIEKMEQQKLEKENLIQSKLSQQKIKFLLQSYQIKSPLSMFPSFKD